MKKIIIIIFLLTGCSDMIFLYESTTESKNTLKNMTTISVLGDDREAISLYLNNILNLNNLNPEFKLSLISVKTKTPLTLEENSVASKYIITQITLLISLKFLIYAI